MNKEIQARFDEMAKHFDWSEEEREAVESFVSDVSDAAFERGVDAAAYCQFGSNN